MTERVQLSILRWVGFATAAAALLLTVHFGHGQPLLFGAISSLIAWYVGKTTGEPIAAVTIQALNSMHPASALEAVRKVALETTQPEQADEVVRLFSRALHSMHPPPSASAVRIIDDEAPP